MRLPLNSRKSRPSATFSIALQSSRSTARYWSKYATCRLVPALTSPFCGCSSPSSSFSSVVLPLPLGPIRPMRSPRRMVVEKSRTIVRSPKANEMSLMSMTFLPELTPWAASILTLPLRSRRAERSLRIAFRRRTRPSSRVRRALMPWRIHTSSCASSLSNRAFSCACALRRSSRRRS
ncbi:hypothetical protein D3C73_940820 [compost metagenome]